MVMAWCKRLSQALFGPARVSGHPRRLRSDGGKRPTAERTSSLEMDPYRTVELCCVKLPVAAGDGPGLSPGR